MLTQRRKLPFPGEQSAHPADPGPAAPAAGAVMSVADRVPTLVAARILASCRARRRAASPADLAARLDRRFVVTPTSGCCRTSRVRAVEELDQRDIGTGKSRLHLPGARSIGPLLPGSCPNAP